MKCLRCGHCCKNYWVEIVDNPKLGIHEDNLTTQMGDGTPCKHLSGDSPGKYKCLLHNYKWYKETPCYRHGQIEQSPNCVCRMGEFILKQLSEK